MDHKLVRFICILFRKEELNEVNKTQLKRNIELVEQGGAKIETIYAGDIPFQIIEYAKSKHVSKIIIGRSVEKRIGIFKKMSLYILIVVFIK